MNLKYKKNYKKKIKNINFNKLKADFLGIRILESCRLTAKQLEAIRRVFVRETKREGSFFIRVQNNQLLTKKSKGSRMGKGVGSVDC
jgi:ribosomal protein L16/L10AE